MIFHALLLFRKCFSFLLQRKVFTFLYWSGIFNGYLAIFESTKQVSKYTGSTNAVPKYKEKLQAYYVSDYNIIAKNGVTSILRYELQFLFLFFLCLSNSGDFYVFEFFYFFTISYLFFYSANTVYIHGARNYYSILWNPRFCSSLQQKKPRV